MVLNHQPPKPVHPIEFVKIRTLEQEGIEGGIWKDKTRIGIQDNGSKWLIKLSTKEESDEVVTYNLAQTFFEGIVPETHIIELAGNRASAQKMVTGKSAHELEADGTLYERVRQANTMRDLGNMIVMDFMIGNPDRHGNNWIIMDNGRIAAIDNGFASKEMNMPITRALRPAYKSLMADDCARTPALISIIRGILGRIDGKEEEADHIVTDFSMSSDHVLVGVWQPKVIEIRFRLDQWQRELDEHCN